MQCRLGQEIIPQRAIISQKGRNCCASLKIRQKSYLLTILSIFVLIFIHAWEEIAVARTLLSNFLSSCLVKRKGSVAEKIKSTIIDKLKKLLDCGLNLPEFHATDLSCLSPVGVEHIDISAFLQEISLLRTEVRAAMSIRVELANIRASLNSLFPTIIGNCNNTSVKSPCCLYK